MPAVGTMRSPAIGPSWTVAVLLVMPGRSWLFVIEVRKAHARQLAVEPLFNLCDHRLFVSIHQGLLGSPDMQILGNDSSNLFLKWFQDRASGPLPRPWVISLPMFCYRIAMLSWALWVAWAFISWLKWGWKCFTKGGTWRPVKLVKKTT